VIELATTKDRLGMELLKGIAKIQDVIFEAGIYHYRILDREKREFKIPLENRPLWIKYLSK
jgi:hypothetical protein